MINFLPTIGIEVHVELNTKSKMFSPSKNAHNDPVNTNINEIDLALPGVLPSVNKAVVIKGIQLAKALQMQIDSNLRFDRKNYFYQDLPKGFQITQQYYPIGKNGIVDIGSKKIGVERIHLEEDTAKQVMIGNSLCLDYNRSGVPLIEIVSRPDMHSAIEAYQYLTNLKRIISFLNISDAKMEEGSLRADINISLAPVGADYLGTKTEIKNINSFANVMKAIEYEIDRQSKILLTNNLVNQETRRWDDQTKTTVYMRSKSNVIDYCYFTEPNIIHMQLDQNFVLSAINKMNKVPLTIKEGLVHLGINQTLIEQLLDDFELYQLFDRVVSATKEPNLTITWIVVELVSLLKKQNKTLSDINSNIVKFIIDMIKLQVEGKINGKQAKTIFEKIITEQKSPEKLINELGFKQITDEKLIKSYLQEIIAKSANMVSQYNERPERVEKFIIGQLMKETHGQANPIISANILKKLLNKE